MRTSTVKILTTALLTLVVSLFTVSSNAGEAYNVGTEPTFPPFEMLDSKTGEITGFDIELIKAIAADQGFEVNVTALGFDGLIPAVLTGKIDMAASGITITEKRAEVVSFTTSYINAGLGVVVKSGNDEIKTIADLVGKTAAVQIGSSGQKNAEDMQKAGKLGSVVVMDNSALAITDLLKGRVDVVINDIPVNTAYVKQAKGKLVMLEEPLNVEQYGFVVNKKSAELLEKMNKGLENVRKDGTYDKLYDKYFKTDK